MTSTREACDSCGARALWVATLKSGLPLAFCAHHMKPARPALEKVGAQITSLKEEATK